MYRVSLFALLFCLSCSGSRGDIIAKAGTETIYKAEFEKKLKFELNKYSQKLSADKLKDIKKALLDTLIRESLLFSAAKNAGIDVSENELAQELVRHKSRYTEATFQKMLQLREIKYSDWKEDKRRELLIDKLIQKEVVSKLEISDKDIEKYYRTHSKEFMHGDEVHARQILVDNLKTAEDIRARLAKGENFAALAQEFSIAPEGKRGGDLGWFPRGVMPKAFDEACFPLPTGAISPIVKTEFGFHIFKVMERRPAKKAPLTEVRDKIIARLQQERSKEAFDKWYAELEKKADVKVYFENNQ